MCRKGNRVLVVVGRLSWARKCCRQPVAGADKCCFGKDVLSCISLGQRRFVEVSYIGALLLASGNLADVDGIRRPVAVGLDLDGLRINRRTGTGVCGKNLLDLGVGEIGEFQVQPGNQVVEGDDGCWDKERTLVGVVLVSCVSGCFG